jgi:cytoskeletal protein RodZ
MEFMSLIDNIRKKTPAQKLKIIWTVVIVIVIVMVGIWIISARYYKNVAKDTTLFQSLGKGIKDVQDNYKK